MPKLSPGLARAAGLAGLSALAQWGAMSAAAAASGPQGFVIFDTIPRYGPTGRVYFVPLGAIAYKSSGVVEGRINIVATDPPRTIRTWSVRADCRNNTATSLGTTDYAAGGALSQSNATYPMRIERNSDLYIEHVKIFDFLCLDPDRRDATPEAQRWWTWAPAGAAAYVDAELAVIESAPRPASTSAVRAEDAAPVASLPRQPRPQVATAPASAPASARTAPPARIGEGQSFRPEFRGTVEYSGSYSGQNQNANPVGGDFSISLEILGPTEIRGNYKSTGQFGSGRIWGKRSGDLCILQQSNLIWNGHCGPDGFFINIASGNGTRSPLQISLNGSNVSYPSDVDQTGMQPKPKGPSPLDALVEGFAKQAAEDRAASIRNRIANNQLAARAISNKISISQCLKIQNASSYYTEFGPVQDGLFTVNRDHSVKYYYDEIVNSCQFVVDVKMGMGFISVGANGSSRKNGDVNLSTARPHIFPKEDLK